MTKVLVVDDDVQAAETLALLLEISGHDVQVVHDGKMAIEAWNSHRHPVVFLDLGLPDLDGYDVARTIRDAQDFDVPLVVALTGQGSDVVPQTRRCGFDVYLQKPATASDIMSAVAKVSLAEQPAID